MIRRPAGCLGIDPAEPKLGQIEFLDKDVDDANRIVLADPVLQAFGKQRALPATRPLNKAPHPPPRKSPRESYRQNHIMRSVFTQPGPEAAVLAESFLETITGYGFEALPISLTHARLAGLLPSPHRDPFDRMLAAQAQ